MVLNRKAQMGVISFVLVLVIALIIWAFLAPFISDQAADYVTRNSLTGIEAFFWYYVNVWIFLAICLAAFVVISFGGSQ